MMQKLEPRTGSLKPTNHVDRVNVIFLCRARNFTQFTAELFLNLMLESRDGLERFAVLGRGTLGVVRKLVDHPNDANLQCSIKVLKVGKLIRVVAC